MENGDQPDRSQVGAFDARAVRGKDAAPADGRIAEDVRVASVRRRLAAAAAIAGIEAAAGPGARLERAPRARPDRAPRDGASWGAAQ